LQQIEQQALGLSELLISQRPQNQRLSHRRWLASVIKQYKAVVPTGPSRFCRAISESSGPVGSPE
jgi:hypothetical protein